MEFDIEIHIDNALKSSENYFITFLTDRFEYLTELWSQTLKKRFGKNFKPIWIFPSNKNKALPKDNYIVIRPKLTKTFDKNFVKLIENTDINKIFSESTQIQDIIDKLVQKQGKLFVINWTNSFLNISNPKVTVIGPDSKLVTVLDNKIEHIHLFKELDLPRNHTRIYSNIAEIKAKEKFPFYISASYSSGGHESGSIYTEKDLDKFYVELRDTNKQNYFLVADIIKDIISSPNTNAIVLGENTTKIICISEQILRGNVYLGNIYPWKIENKFKKIRQTIIQITKCVGDYLSKKGFRGMFGLDFIINKQGEVFTIDLNPRHQGGYLCNVLMSNKVNLLDIELKLNLNENIPDFSESDLHPNFCWAHTKLKGYTTAYQIKKSLTEGTPTEPFSTIGKSFYSIFYPKDIVFEGNAAGYFITSDENYNKLIAKRKPSSG